MTQDLFIGVDGGATKCVVRVEDAAGNLLGQEVGGPANIRLSVEQAWHSIYSTLNQILKPQDISLSQYTLHSGMGLAGCEAMEAYRAFVGTQHEFGTLVVTSDAHTACLGAHGGKDGAIIIVGTGVIGYQSRQGKATQVSGWGFPYDDEGGGAWIGLQAIKHVLQCVDGRAVPSVLSQAVLCHFNENLGQLVDWLYHANATQFATLAPLVIQHGQQGDVTAMAILNEAAQAINNVGHALDDKLPCVLVGGVAPFLKPLLNAELQERLCPGLATPAVGAILLVRVYHEMQKGKSMTASRVIFSGMKVLVEQQWLSKQAIVVEGQQIKAILPEEMIHHHLPAHRYEFPGDYYLIPGLIDLHIHGTNGKDVMDGTEEALHIISRSLSAEGITGYLATTMTAQYDKIETVLQVIDRAMQETEGAAILGVHLEGPFIAAAKIGAQRGEYVEVPSVTTVQHWQKIANNAIKLVTLAPELPGAIELITALRKMGVIASIGHTDATYDETIAAIAAGCTQATHLFNAMSGLNHRKPGAALALLMSEDVSAELICDGLHVHPAIVDLTEQVKGKDKLLLVTDAMRAKCLGDGEYELGGQRVQVVGGKATLNGGILAGSTLRMPEAIKNMVQYSRCSLADAIHMASYNPAKALGLFAKKGSIAVGKDADLVVMNTALEVQMTMREGGVTWLLQNGVSSGRHE